MKSIVMISLALCLALTLCPPSCALSAVFVGDSITQGNDWQSAFPNLTVTNAGISGDTSAGVSGRIGAIAAGKPDNIFLMIGINDLIRGSSSYSVNDNMDSLLNTACTQSENTSVVVFSILPTYTAAYEMRNAPAISVNSHTEAECQKYDNCRYVDLRQIYNTQEPYQEDGLHLTGPGYYAWEQKSI